MAPGLGSDSAPCLQEGILVCSSVLAGWQQGAAATFSTVFQGESYEVGARVGTAGCWVPRVGTEGCDEPRCPRGLCACVLPLWPEGKEDLGAEIAGEGMAEGSPISCSRCWIPSWGAPWCQDMSAGVFWGCLEMLLPSRST